VTWARLTVDERTASVSEMNMKPARAVVAGVVIPVLLVATGFGGESRLPRSDRFNGRTLDRSWSTVQPDLVSARVRDGALSLALSGPALWFNDSVGVLVFKPVSGSFKATTTVRTRSQSEPDQPPRAAIRLGGLMARDPASDETRMQNYVHIVVGNGPDGVLAVEHKTTTNNNSVYEAPAWSSSEAQLRICRLGSTYSLYKRPVGSKTWQLASSYERPDLPETLQVGADVYSPNAPPDLRARWSEITFQRVTNPRSCTSDRR
jgi:hypothetical protein